MFLYRADNNKLKSDLRKRDEEVASLQAALERFTVAVSNITFFKEILNSAFATLLSPELF